MKRGAKKLKELYNTNKGMVREAVYTDRREVRSGISFDKRIPF